MIQEFRVSNFLSFNEEQVLSFEATSDKTYEDIYCIKKKSNLRLLKIGIIKGANASGKSNLLKALDYLRTIVQNRPKNKSTQIQLSQFAFDPESKKKPTSFYLSFFSGPIRYIYTMELNQSVILKESLSFYPGIQPAVAFERIYDAKEDKAVVTFGDLLNLDAREKLILEGNIFKNSTVLAAYNMANVSSKVLTDVLAWFASYFSPLIGPNDDLQGLSNEFIYEDVDAKSIIIEMMQKADFNVKDIMIKKEQETNSESHTIFKIITFPEEKIYFLHQTPKGNFELPMDAQSAGTQRYYSLASLIYLLQHNDKVIMIDELESSLHFDLMAHFLRTFLVNSRESQIIFTTHNNQILAEDFLRRDIVWFTEKKKDGSTELFSYTDVKLHKNISPFNAYKIGKIGAKPELGSIYLNE